MRLYICEKPSQGRDLANVIGVQSSSRSHIDVKGGVVTWGYGHLLESAEPAHYDAKYKNWSYDSLPIIPEEFAYLAKDSGKQQLAVIGKLLKEADDVVIATDPDREGEMIGREILKHYDYRGPCERLMLTALDTESIQKAIKKMLDGKDTVHLYHAALARSQADWLVGINLTRAISLKSPQRKGAVPIGRVKTPTLAIVVRRDREIENFVSRRYYELIAECVSEGHSLQLKHAPGEEERIYDVTRARDLADALVGKSAPLQVAKEKKRKGPPKLYSLSLLQREANAKYGITADRVLKIAQSLYERQKYLTYPRSDCNFLPNEQEVDIPTILANIVDVIPLSRGITPVIRQTTFDTKKVTAHHAIIPTKVKPNLDDLDKDERNIYRLVAERYVANLMDDYVYEQTSIQGTFEGVLFSTKGNVTLEAGWTILGTNTTDTVLPPVSDGSDGEIENIGVESKDTKPPAHYTDGTLIADMERVSKFVQDSELKSKLKETAGIGTEATRANIIEELKRSELLASKGKKILSTDNGRKVIAMVEKYVPEIADPGETASWEQQLESIVSRDDRDGFCRSIAEKTAEYIDNLSSLKGGDGHNMRPEGKPTGETSWHKDHEGEEILDYGKYWAVPGFGNFFKVMFKREMSLDDYKAITQSKETVEFQGFISSKGKPFEAGLKYNSRSKPYPKVELVFKERQTPQGAGTGVECKQGTITDCGDFYVLSKPKCRIYKNLCNKELSAQDIKAIVDSPNGVEITGFVSKKTNKAYSATVKYNSKAKPYPKLELVFEQKQRTRKGGRSAA